MRERKGSDATQTQGMQAILSLGWASPSLPITLGKMLLYLRELPSLVLPWSSGEAKEG